MSARTIRAFNKTYDKAARGRPGSPAKLTDEEHALLLTLIRLHQQHCTEPGLPNSPNCRLRGGYLRGKPWYGNDLKKARALGLLV